MATMRLARQAMDTRTIGLWLAGVVCGVALVVGIGQLRQPAAVTPSAPSAFEVTVPQLDQGMTGGRLGGIGSADTAVDAQTRQALSLSGQPLAQSRPEVVGGRLGGLEQADTPTVLTGQRLEPVSVIGGRLGGLESAEGPVDAAAKAEASRIVGPGEGAAHH